MVLAKSHFSNTNMSGKSSTTHQTPPRNPPLVDLYDSISTSSDKTEDEDESIDTTSDEDWRPVNSSLKRYDSLFFSCISIIKYMYVSTIRVLFKSS